jgi:hypothetical protein
VTSAASTVVISAKTATPLRCCFSKPMLPVVNWCMGAA